MDESVLFCLKCIR